MIAQQNGHIPGPAELAIEQTFQQTPKPRKSLLWFFPGRANKPRSEQTSKPANEQTAKRAQVNSKPRRASKLETINKTSSVHVEFASLVYLETGLQWAENLIHILTPRLLVIGFVLSMVDLLTHGSLLNIPAMIYAWAIIQAMAVDATLPNMWRLAFTRFDARRYWSGGILLLIGAALALVVFAALSIQFLQQTQNLSLDQTMIKLGISPEVLTYVRSSSVVFLAAVLSVLNRSKVTSVHKTAAQETSKPVQASEPAQVSELQTEHAGAGSERTIQQTEPLHIVGKQTGAPVRLVSKQEQIRALLEENSDITVTDIVKAAGVSKGYASQQRAQFLSGRNFLSEE